MAISLMLLAAAAAPSIEAAQTGYTSCLSAAFDAAVNARTPAPEFSDKVPGLCPRETAAFRAASVEHKLAEDRTKPGFKPEAARAAATAGFAQTDAANRQAMLESFGISAQSRKAPVRTVGK
jgi:hypothetical protein